MTTKLYVANLPETCRKIDLECLFQKYGTVVECDIVQNYAFVHFEEPDEATTAVENLNGFDFGGSLLRVEVSRSKVRQKPGMGEKGDCYKCGKSGHWSKDCPKGGRGRGRGGPPRRGAPYDPYERSLYRDPYADPYYRSRYLPPPVDRYRPYADPYDRRPLPPPERSPYYRDRDPYARPPPEYYGRRSPPPARDPYYDPYYPPPRARYPPPPPSSEANRASPPRGRVPGPY